MLDNIFIRKFVLLRILFKEIVMKLELKHIAPYLPYGLKYASNQNFETQIGRWRLDRVEHQIKIINDGKFQNDFKPILRPLSDCYEINDLQEDIENFIGLMDWCDYYYDYLKILHNSGYGSSTIVQAPYVIFQYFLSNHFDVFGLIPKSLAIDINDLKGK